MQPNAPSGPPPNPYSFLYEQPVKKRSLMPAGGSYKGKLILIIGAALLLIIILAIAKSLFGSSGNVALTSLYSVAGDQQELINLTTIATSDTTDTTYANFSATTLASLTTDQQNLNGLLSKNGIKLNSKLLPLSPSLDSQLNQSQQQNNFDSIYPPVMEQELNKYQADLSTAYSQNKSAVLKTDLSNYYNHVKLLKQLLAHPAA